jgi:hypothetical protein
MNFAHHAHHTISETDQFRATMDEFRRPADSPTGFDQFLLVHLKFHEFTKSALAQFLHGWSLFRSATDAPLFAFCDDGDSDHSKWERFVGLLGFKHVPDTVVPDQDGRSRRVFVSLKDFAHGRQATDN